MKYASNAIASWTACARMLSYATGKYLRESLETYEDKLAEVDTFSQLAIDGGGSASADVS